MHITANSRHLECGLSGCSATGAHTMVSSKPRILVTGATDKTGGQVAAQRLAAGYPVRAYVGRKDGRSACLKAAGAEIRRRRSRRSSRLARSDAGRATWLLPAGAAASAAHVGQLHQDVRRPHERADAPRVGPAPFRRHAPDAPARTAGAQRRLGVLASRARRAADGCTVVHDGARFPSSRRRARRSTRLTRPNTSTIPGSPP